MARVKRKNTLLARMADWYARRAYGRTMEQSWVMAHTPWNMAGYAALELGHERSHKMEERPKMLAATKAATWVGCRFCIDIGTALGRKSGVTEEQLRDFHSYKESVAFSRVEKLVLEYAEAMTMTPVEISDELFASLREHFDDAEIVDLTMAIAIENLRARFNHALEIPVAGFSEGAYCPLPEKEAQKLAAGA